MPVPLPAWPTCRTEGMALKGLMAATGQPQKAHTESSKIRISCYCSDRCHHAPKDGPALG